MPSNKIKSAVSSRTIIASASMLFLAVVISFAFLSVPRAYASPAARGLACPASSGTVGTPYSSSLVATDLTPPYTFTVVSGGGLFPPLKLNIATGAITGTPTVAGTYLVSFNVLDSTGLIIETPSCTININPGSASVPQFPIATLSPLLLIALLLPALFLMGRKFRALRSPLV